MAGRSTLLDRHATALERVEEAQARQVAAAYRKARQEILDRLVTRWHGTDLLTPEQAASLLRQSGLLQQIDARLLQLEAELGVNLRSIVTSSSELALEQVRQELALLPASLRPGPQMFGTINTRMIERFVPVAMQDVQLGTRSLSLTLQRELQTGLIQGQSFDSLVKRVMSATPGDLGVSVWRRGEVSAELATRRLVITAENMSKQAALEEVHQELPEVQKQWISAIGPNTTDCCLRAHGQIQPLDQPFELTGTPRFADQLMSPPGHWNCRSSIALYHPIFERGGLTTANMRKSAAAQLAKSRDAKGGN